jgi:hypothetical protein
VNRDDPVAEFEFRGGALRGSRLTLYPNRIVHEGADTRESVPLAQLAAVRIAFEREPGKLGWAIALVVLALALAALAAPLGDWAAGAAAEVAESASRASPGGGGVAGVLHSVFKGLAVLASLLPAIAAALAAWAAALGAFYWFGLTRLTLCYAALERGFAVRGRDRLLIEFAAELSERIAALGK